tara:strand:+ start:10275 stop:11981 length:1707 start_codon:yes stop_codon:yes gene_type:complete
MSVISTLTEGIRQRSLANEGEALLEKWEKTGLLEGLNDTARSSMSRLLENQAAQLLKETTTMQAGDVEGFASVAFPIVRRVFGGLLAQDLVSVQPMSLPSGLIFFLDFVFSADNTNPRLGNIADTSLYGGGVVGKDLQNGVNLADANQEQSFYSLNNGYSSPTGSSTNHPSALTFVAANTFGDSGTLPGGAFFDVLKADPDLISGTSTYAIYRVRTSALSGANFSDLTAIVHGTGTLSPNSYQARRLTSYSGSAQNDIHIVGISRTGIATAVDLSASIGLTTGLSFPIVDQFVAAGDPFGAIAGSNASQGWGLETQANIPEIDIKVDSTAVTAITKKLKAKWSPELAQDLNAYHNLDAEVELTSILSEQIALEIDQEILNDLVNEATAGTLFWSRRPGKFVNRETGADITNSLHPDFAGTVSEWYETLLETINDVSARLHRKTLRGGANFIVCSPEVSSLLEFTSGFRASVEVDGDKGSWGANQVGSLSRKMDIYVDPYFMRNVILVGRKGTSFLESGYVYAPYVPLQVTPTIFGVEDFVPRKGVMTRYAKKMVRPDMYGLVIVADLV